MRLAGGSSVLVNISTSDDYSKDKKKAKAKESPENMIVKQACLVTDMNNGEMREIEIEKHKVLLIKSKGEFSAIGSTCPHYGAPLVKGVLLQNRVRCPWHGACFNIKTGDIEEFPTLDSVQCFTVEVQDQKVFISADINALETPKRIKHMVTQSPENKQVTLLIGGGPAALTCAETLRQDGYKGRIILATKEEHLPYDRPKLSKVWDGNIESILLRHPEFYLSYGIEVLTNKEAVSVNVSKKRVGFKDGMSQQYEHLLIATGSIPRRLTCPGMDLENVWVLRTPEDTKKIRELSIHKKVVIVGTSFIGMEVAAVLADRAESLIVVGTSVTPYQAVLGKEIGEAIKKMFEEKNVRFYMEDGVNELRGENGKLKEIELSSGTILPADLCVVGIGVVPATSFLSGSGVSLSSNGTVVVDKYMNTSNSKIFAAGDVTSFPLSLQNDQIVNVSHWQMAQMQGHIAALNMIKKKKSIHSVPFFWTVLFGKSLRYAGYGGDYEEIIFKGNVSDLKFVAFYIKEEQVVAVASMNYDPMVSHAAEVMASGKSISKMEAQDKDMPWMKII
eukprot:gi/632958059/ref/XP_007894821.1/ PREDICTED: apoptosis-inducing factor 3-like isoform X2 [Callorhinchus milii]